MCRDSFVKSKNSPEKNKGRGINKFLTQLLVLISLKYVIISHGKKYKYNLLNTKGISVMLLSLSNDFKYVRNQYSSQI